MFRFKPSLVAVLPIALGLTVKLAFGDDAPLAPIAPRSSVAAPKPAENALDKRRREGTRIFEQAGRFEFVGERIAFFPSGESESIRVLENLAAERIIRLLGESRGQQDWLVSGTLTEFRGSNYLLVTKAVIRPSSERPSSH